MQYIEKVAEEELWNAGKVELWNFSRANQNKESRIEAVATVASICYGKPPRDARKLVERLWTESGGLPSSAFEFIRGCDCEECDDVGIDASLRNWGKLPTNEKWAEWHGEKIGAISEWHKGAVATFRLTVPIFLARQIMRHRQFSYQERSLRFTKVSLDDAIWYIPPEVSMDVHNLFAEAYEKEIVVYTKLLEAGVPRERARAVLGVGLSTQLWMQGDVPAWKNYFKLRLDQHTQKEHRELAQAMLTLLEEHQPELWRKVKP